MARPVFEFDHSSVSVGDLGEARAFYGETLGFEELERPEFSFPGVWYRIGHLSLHLTTGGHLPGGSATLRANNPHVAIAVEGDLDGFLDELRSQGVTVKELEDSPSALRQALIKDPWGNVFEFCVNSPSKLEM